MMVDHMNGGQDMVVHEETVLVDMSNQGHVINGNMVHGQAMGEHIMGEHIMGETVMVEMPMGEHIVDGQVIQGQVISTFIFIKTLISNFSTYFPCHLFLRLCNF